jgi:hypothetical protein
MASVIPLSGGESNANQLITVQLGDYLVDIELHYQQSGQWLAYVLPNGDAGDIPTYTVNGTEYLFAGVMLEPGCDIIKSYAVTKTFGQLFVFGDEPTLENLGENNKLVWYSPDEALIHEAKTMGINN